MTQAYYRKWRPQTWDQVIGQEHITTTLRNAVAHDRVAHAYLFAGPRGTGKTSSARLLAKAVNCLVDDLAQRPCNQCNHCQAVNQGRFIDLIEIDAASNTSVDDVRDLRDKINFSPNQGRYKVYIIDEVHMLSTAAFNALLKTLEEPPPHAIFVLATTEVHKIPATVLSRCQRHEFRSIPVIDMVQLLAGIAESENLEIGDDTLALIARQATGSLRDAVSLLDQLAATSPAITLPAAQAILGTATNQAVLDILDALQAGDAAGGLNCIHRTLDTGSDPRQFARQIIDYLRNLLLFRVGNADQVETAKEIRAKMAAHAQAFGTAELLAFLRNFNRAAAEARNAWQPALPLEMAFVESLGGPAPEPVQPSRATSTPKKNPVPAQSRPTTYVHDSASVEESAQTAPVEKEMPNEIYQHWERILKMVREQNPQTQALLNSCSPLGVKGNALVLGFNGEFAKSKMETGENITILQKVMESVLGKAMSVLCVVSQGGELPLDIDQDGMVATALRDLGGKIVDVQ